MQRGRRNQAVATVRLDEIPFLHQALNDSISHRTANRADAHGTDGSHVSLFDQHQMLFDSRHGD